MMTIFRKSAVSRARPIAMLAALFAAAASGGCSEQQTAIGTGTPSKDAFKESVQRSEATVAKSQGSARRGQPPFKNIKGKVAETSPPG